MLGKPPYKSKYEKGHTPAIGDTSVPRRSAIRETRSLADFCSTVVTHIIRQSQKSIFRVRSRAAQAKRPKPLSLYHIHDILSSIFVLCKWARTKDFRQNSPRFFGDFGRESPNTVDSPARPPEITKESRAEARDSFVIYPKMSGSSDPCGRSNSHRWSSRRYSSSRCRAPGRNEAVQRRTTRPPRGGAVRAGCADC